MNLGFSEMAFIFVLALIIFGPKKLPEIGRQIGKALAEFKRASNEFKWQLEAEMRQIEAEATRERLTKAAPTEKPVEAVEDGEQKILAAPAEETYPSSFGEFRPTSPSQHLAPPAEPEIISPESVTPTVTQEDRKGHDA